MLTQPTKCDIGIINRVHHSVIFVGVIPGGINKEFNSTSCKFWFACLAHKGDHPYQVLASYVLEFPTYSQRYFKCL